MRSFLVSSLHKYPPTWTDLIIIPVYAKYGSTCLSSITFWNAIPVFWLSDGDAIKFISANRKAFPKDVEAVCAQYVFARFMTYLQNIVRNLEHIWAKYNWNRRS